MRKQLFVLGVFLALTAALLVWVSAQTCDRQTERVTGYTGGDDSTLAVLDGITNDTEELILRLRQAGANFQQTSDYPVSTNLRMTGAAADFNGDGFVDLAEGGRSQDNDGQSSDTNLSVFLCQGQNPSDPTRFVFTGPFYINYLATLSTYEIMALGAGDFNGDGDNDIVALSWRGRLWYFENYYVENGHDPGDNPDFDTSPALIDSVLNDTTSEYGYTSDGPHFRWEGNIECVDIDNDDDIDWIVGVPQRYAWSRYGEVVIYINNGSGTFSRLNGPGTGYPAINPYPNNDNNRYGVCGVAAADFDNDGDIDFYVGSAVRAPEGATIYIYFYRNNNLTFSQVTGRRITMPTSSGTCTYLRAGDVDNDGLPDMVLATDGWTANSPGGYVYWYENDAGTSMIRHPVPDSGEQVSPSDDLDSGAIGDFDNDGDLDFFVADGNDSLNCYFFMNDSYPIYVPTGTVYSKNLLPCSFLIADSAIVSATIYVDENKPAGTSIQYYLANSNDQNGQPLWEGPVTPGVEFEFQSPGDFLRWRAVFTSSDIRFTPKIYHLDLEYKYITKREYSRTSHTVTKVEVDPTHTDDEEVLYSASFEFPKWRGHLRSWNVTDLGLAYDRGSQLADIRDVGAELVQDAGINLRDRTWSTRVVYTAYDAEADGVMNDRLDFDESSADALDDFLGLGEGSPEVPPLIRFVLGENRTWKLGDINHSSPKALNPPSGTASLMGSGYADFQSANENRRKVILVGANDGMLHCFDAVTLEELWAFIPNNLLYKLRRMKVVDPDCGEYLYHHFFVDGTPTIQDVYFGSAWHTVLVCGQGAGWGKDQKCYYFALDVTDPESPQPLWEFTDEFMGETWSVPAITKIPSPDRWAVFFGSGYDNDSEPGVDIGHYFYSLDVGTGQVLRSFEITEPGEPASPFGIQNTLPGSPEIADTNSDGYGDAVYFGDLKGRLWKIALSSDTGGWDPEAVYHDPYMHPIITKPAVSISQTDQTAHVYFGTGGDEASPASASYSFIALVDGTTANVEWFIGPDDLADQLGIGLEFKKAEFAPGERVWADPVISDRVVYIATLEGSIESLNPCTTLSGAGRIYGRNTLGSQVGGTALLTGAGAPVGFLETKQKVRSAVTIGETQIVQESGQSDINKRKVFIQSYTQPSGGTEVEPPSQVLAQPVPATQMVIRSWREVYKVFKR